MDEQELDLVRASSFELQALRALVIQQQANGVGALLVQTLLPCKRKRKAERERKRERH